MLRSHPNSARIMMRVSWAALLLFFVTRFVLERMVHVPERILDPLSGMFLGIALGAMIVSAARKR